MCGVRIPVIRLDIEGFGGPGFSIRVRSLTNKAGLDVDVLSEAFGKKRLELGFTDSPFCSETIVESEVK